MSTHISILRECDYCGVESTAAGAKKVITVSEHVVTWDGRPLDAVDACPTCWEQKEKALKEIVAPGRPKKAADRENARLRQQAGIPGRRPGQKVALKSA